ncbi:hypothetical protein ACOSP7_022045 [Xanthoceras sorbifolium]
MKARGANGIRYPSSPSYKRWILGAVRIDPCNVVANALIATVEFGTLSRLPVISRRKVRMTSSHHAPYAQGDTHATMAGTKGRDPVRELAMPKVVTLTARRGCKGKASDWSEVVTR